MAATASANAAMDAWMSLAAHEDALEPDLPLIDAHHHLWDHSVGRAATATTATTATAAELAAWQGGGRQRVWLLHDVLADIQASGHNIVDTVFVQAGAFHRASGPEELRPTGESEFVQGVAAMCESGLYAPPATVIGAAIVGTCDLRHSNVEAVLRAHMRSRNFRGIRMLRRINPPVPQEVAGGERDVALDRGFALLERFGLSFDCWQTSGEERDYASVPRVTALARRYPGVTIILNHLGCPVGPAMSADEFAQWRVDLKELAECCPNVVCKVGGIAMPVNGWGWERGARPVTSEEMCEATLPYYGHAIDCFGPERCMFESNFPVDKDCASYGAVWNCFKRIAEAKGLSPQEKRAIFHDTAKRVYRIGRKGGPPFPTEHRATTAAVGKL